MVTTTGNVGIGTTNPQTKLDVSGNVNVSGNIVAARPTTPDQLATKGYVDEVVAAGPFQNDYTFCYVTGADGTITCESGYTKILTTQGLGCQNVIKLVESAPDAGDTFLVGNVMCYWYGGVYRDDYSGGGDEVMSLRCGGSTQTVGVYCDAGGGGDWPEMSDVAMCCK